MAALTEAEELELEMEQARARATVKGGADGPQSTIGAGVKEFGRSVGEGSTGLLDLPSRLWTGIRNLPGRLSNSAADAAQAYAPGVDPADFQRNAPAPVKLEDPNTYFNTTFNAANPPNPDYPTVRRAGNIVGAALPAVVTGGLAGGWGAVPGVVGDVAATTGVQFGAGLGARKLAEATGGDPNAAEEGASIFSSFIPAAGRNLVETYNRKRLIDEQSRARLADLDRAGVPADISLVGSDRAAAIGPLDPSIRARQQAAIDASFKAAADARRGGSASGPIASSDIGKDVANVADTGFQSANKDANTIFGPMSEAAGRNTPIDHTIIQAKIDELRNLGVTAKPTLDYYQNLLDADVANGPAPRLAGKVTAAPTSESSGSFVAREAGQRVGSESIGSIKQAGHFYRGLTQTEYQATLGARGGVKSSGAYSLKGEGTSFADDPADAESYINFGRDDPRTTGKPTYLVEVGGDGVERKSDGYYQAKGEVQPTRVWEMRPEGGAIVAHPVDSASPAPVDIRGGLTWDRALRQRRLTEPSETSLKLDPNIQKQINSAFDDALRKRAGEVGYSPQEFDAVNSQYGGLQGEKDILSKIRSEKGQPAYNEVFSPSNLGGENLSLLAQHNDPSALAKILADNLELRARGPSAAGRPELPQDVGLNSKAADWWASLPEETRAAYSANPAVRDQIDATMNILRADARRTGSPPPLPDPTAALSIGGAIASGNPVLAAGALPRVGAWLNRRNLQNEDYLRTIVGGGSTATPIQDLARILSGAVQTGR